MGKFCTKCGNEMPADGSPCPNCEPAQVSEPENKEPGKSISQMTVSEIGQSFKANAQSIKIEPEDADHAAVNVGGNKVKVATIIKGIAIALAVMYFLPWFTVSCSGVKITFSGFNATFGKYVHFYDTPQWVGGSIAALFLLLIPAALFAIFHFEKKMPFISGKMFIISTILSAVGLIGFIGVGNSINTAGGGYIVPSYSFWYYFSMILYIATGVISLFCIKTAKKKVPKADDSMAHDDSNMPPPENA